MEFSLPIPTLIIALLALWIAHSNYRRNNFVVLRVVESSCSFPKDIRENAGQGFICYRILIRNLGIPLHSVSMVLVFHPKDGAGTMSYPITRKTDDNDAKDQLAKGMVAEFFLKSYRIPLDDLVFLLTLENCYKQAASLCIYSDGYLAAELSLSRFLDKFKTKWNWLAFRINHMLRRELGKSSEGIPIVKYYEVLPRFQILGVHMDQFVAALRRHAAKETQ